MTIRELIVELANVPRQQRPVRMTDGEYSGDAPTVDIVGLIDHGDHLEVTCSPSAITRHAREQPT